MKKCMFGSKTKQSNNKLTDTGDYDQGIGSQKLVFGSLQTRQIWPICPSSKHILVPLYVSSTERENVDPPL